MAQAPSASYYFQALQKSFPRLYDRAAQNCHTVLVPVKASLALARIDSDFVRCHTLKPSPYLKDEFSTLDGKTVNIREKKVVTGKGFRYPRTLHILAEESCYNDNFESFRLLLVSAPLVGRVPESALAAGPASKRRVDPLAIARRSLATHSKVLSASVGPQEYPRLKRRLRSFVTQFSSNYMLVRGFLSHAAKRVKDECGEMLAEANPPDAPPAPAAVHVAVESLALATLHEKVFGGICKLHAADDALVDRSIKRLSKVDLVRALGVRKDILLSGYDPAPVSKRLADINAASVCATPLSKLCCLHDAQEAITQCVEKARKEKSSGTSDDGGGEALAADDILPLLAHAVVQLGSGQKWESNLLYLNEFGPDSRQLSSINAGKLGYQLASLQAAVDLVKSAAAEEAGDSKGKEPARTLADGGNGVVPVQAAPRSRLGLGASRGKIRERAAERRRLGPSVPAPMRPGAMGSQPKSLINGAASGSGIRSAGQSLDDIAAEIGIQSEPRGEAPSRRRSGIARAPSKASARARARQRQREMQLESTAQTDVAAPSVRAPLPPSTQRANRPSGFYDVSRALSQLGGLGGGSSDDVVQDTRQGASDGKASTWTTSNRRIRTGRPVGIGRKRNTATVGVVRTSRAGRKPASRSDRRLPGPPLSLKEQALLGLGGGAK